MFQDLRDVLERAPKDNSTANNTGVSEGTNKKKGTEHDSSVIQV
jgi:hypothetical protein